MLKRIITLIIVMLIVFGCARKSTEWKEKHTLDLAVTVPVVGNPLDLDAAGSYVYVAEDQGGLSIINLNDYSKKWYTQIYDETGNIMPLIKTSRISVVPSLNRLFINEREGSDEIRSVDITDLDSLFLVDRITGGTADIQNMKFRDVSGNGSQFVYEGYYCLGGDVSYGKFGIHDSSFPAYWSVTKSYELPEANGAAFIDQYVYVAAEQRGLAIFDFYNETQVGVCDLPGEAQKVKVVGNYAYLPCRQDGLQIVDVTNPAAPVKVSSYDTSGYATNVDIWNDYAIVGSGGGGVYLFDITNPADPVLKDHITDCGYVNNVMFYDGKALVASRDKGILIYNIVP